MGKIANNDIHDSPSHTMISTNPARANEIRQAVMLVSPADIGKMVRHDRREAIISGRERPIPCGAACGRRLSDRGRRVRARRLKFRFRLNQNRNPRFLF
jgi:hypothetical protein